VDGETTKRIVERGPARVVLEITRAKENSTYTRLIQLYCGGAEDRIDIVNKINWQTPNTLLKATFPLSVSNEKATYDLGLGTIQRGSNTDQMYEVPAQQWADITASDGSYGVAILNNCKYGWDKPSGNTLRLTLIHSPQEELGYRGDTGDHHVFTYSIAGHAKGWREGNVVWHAAAQSVHAIQNGQGCGTSDKLHNAAERNMPKAWIQKPEPFFKGIPS
jgi:alpha-mannosidase